MEQQSPESPEQPSAFTRFLFVVKLVEVRLRFIIVVVVAGLVIGNWETIRARWDRFTRPESAGEIGEAGIEYYCPMHPKVVRAGPGMCPI